MKVASRDQARARLRQIGGVALGARWRIRAAARMAFAKLNFRHEFWASI